MKSIQEIIQLSIQKKQELLNDAALLERVQAFCDAGLEAYRAGKKVMLCGNGGSAADAQHIAAELSGRFYFDRPPLDAEALHVNSSYLTAVGNDYGYEYVYARLLESRAKAGDLLIALSTSGNSTNVLAAAIKAKEMGVKVIGLTGSRGGKLASYSDILLNMPSDDTPRIQELHILIGHLFCEYVEAHFFRG